MPKSLQLWKVTLPGASFGIVVASGPSTSNGKVVLAPPAGKLLEGERLNTVARFASSKGGSIEQVVVDLAA